MPIDPEKGIHWPTMLTTTFAILSMSVYQQLTLPNFPFMIKMYFPGIEDSNVGYYMGYLVSLYFLGQIPGSISWGWFADNYGRRTAMILIAIGNILCLFALGLSKNYWLSVVIRLIHGILDGGLGVCKTILADLSNDRNIPVGTGMMFVGGAIGGFFGPILGGYLSKREAIQPFLKYLPFLKDIPYCLPLSVCAFLYIVVLFMYVFWAEETLSKEEMAESKRMKHQMVRELSTIMRKSTSKEFNSHERLILNYNDNSGYSSMLKNRDLIMSITVYGLYAFCQICYDTIFPLTLMNPHKFGGYEMDALEESWISTVGIATQVASLLICPLWSKIVSYRKQLFYCSIVYAFLLGLQPLIALFNQNSLITQFLVSFFAYTITIPVRSISFNICIMVIANSVYKEFRGTSMGLGQLVAGTLRFLGPFFIPTVFSWSTNNNKFPVNFGFSYYIIAIVMMFNAFMCLKISNETSNGKGSVYSVTKGRSQQPQTPVEDDNAIVRL